MEHILNQNFEKTKRMVILACMVSVAMIFGILNPLLYITDRDTPREISNIGKVVNAEATVIPSGKEHTGNISGNIRMLSMKKNLLNNVISDNSLSDVNMIADRVLENTPIISRKSIPLDTISSLTNDMPETITKKKTDHVSAAVPGAITNPVKDDVSDIVPGVVTDPAANQDDVLDEQEYIEIKGMKIDSEGYVTEIVSGISDGLLVFPTDVRCTGIRAEAVEKLDDALKDEVMEIWIPANMTQIEAGTFDCLKNVNFIEAAEGNPAYYSEAGILYHTDGSLACMPQRRVR